ncbi:MAG TPA: metallophosphoesterase [Gammaproteobacteria bacterium]|nr:metallophosphoesterase [Gammaproteobacteria bacterium]
MRRTFYPSRILFPIVLALLAFAPAGSPAAGEYRFSSVERVVAVGDIHGALDEFVAVLQGTGLADEALRWTGGEAHLVSLGDLVDRGDYGRQVMDLLMRLQHEAAAAGGAVHVVLGNHEVMNLTGDLRYVSAGDYAQFGDDAPEGLPPGFIARRAAFAPDGEYGRWLLGLPVMVVIDDTLFVHGGLSARLGGLSLEEINASSRRDLRRFAEGWHALLAAGALGDADDFGVIRSRAATLADSGHDERLRALGANITAALEGLPFVPDGPLWYRGSARCHSYTESGVLDTVLAVLGARRVAIGHTPTQARRITSRTDGRVLRVDTGMNAAAYQGRPAALIIENGVARAWYADEGATEIDAEPNRVWNRPYGMSETEIEEFLRTADVVDMTALKGSEDGRRLVTLESGERRLSAVFYARDSAPRLPRGRWTRAAEQADRYVHEVAAYRLDRLLELYMVPVSVERTIGDESGALRLLIEDGFWEYERRKREIPYTGDCDLKAQYDMMGIFDVLILNPGPQLGLLRYDQEWRVWLMDQSSAFGTARDVDAMLRRAGIRPTPQMVDALARVSPEDAAFLSEYLHRRQVQALVDRAARLRARQ